MKKSLELFHYLMQVNPFERLSLPLEQLRIPLKHSSALLESRMEVEFAEDLVKKSSEGPMVLCVEARSGYGHIELLLMTIPVQFRMIRDDSAAVLLRPDLHYYPQINPGLLETDDFKPHHKIGDAVKYSKLDFSKIPNATDDWGLWCEAALEVFKQVCDAPLDSIAASQALNLESASLSLTIRTLESDAANRSIESLYHYLLDINADELKKTSITHIDEAYFKRFQTTKLDQDFLVDTLKGPGDYLLAHMDESSGEDTGDLRHRELFALDNTQRAVCAVLPKLETGDVLAVNGPPGSGKTAMLKAVISHVYVDAAIEGGDCPIVVGVGGTNQSVTNIINAFPNVLYRGEGQRLYHMRRWFSGPANYGTYFPSGSALDNMPEELKSVTVLGEVASTDTIGFLKWTGRDEKVSDISKLDALKEEYLHHASVFFGEQFTSDTVSSVTEKLRNLLKEKKRTLIKTQQFLLNFVQGLDHTQSLDVLKQREEIQAYLDATVCSKNTIATVLDLLTLYSDDHAQKQEIVGDVCREYIKDCFVEDDERRHKQIRNYLHNLIERSTVILIDRILDLHIRYELFHLAARYWEGRYLLECDRSILITRTADNVEQALRRMCMVTPVLVSTLQSASKLFCFKGSLGSTGKPHLLGVADLLIIDEAGQADIRTALPLLALAKKTVAVGDIDQIPPVITDVTAEQEQCAFDLKRFAVDDTREAIKHSFVHCVKHQLLPSQSGSIMHILRFASRFSSEQRGMSLRGHYRCQGVMSQFCNELVYDNKIFIIKPLFKARGPIKPVTWVPSQYKTTRVGSSHVSKDEAKNISAWLIENWPRFCDHYNKGEEAQLRFPDLIGIISPYKEQAGVFVGNPGKEIGYLHRELLGKFSGKYEITRRDIDQVKVGTVNALQGAEKPIIIFSGVKGIKSEGDIHYRRDTYILNVALSRAKECFVAFICPDTFGIGKSYNEEERRALKDDSVAYLGDYLTRRGHRLFPRKLVVIEADGKKEALESYLGCSYIVQTTGGKLFGLGLNLSDVDYEDGLIPHYTWRENENRGAQGGKDGGKKSKRAMADIIETASDPDIDEVIIATDDDYVGEQIAWHIYAYIERNHPELKRKLKRVRLRAITPKGVEEAFSNPGEVDLRRASAEVAREILDALIARRFSATMKKNIKTHQIGQQYLTAKEKKLFAHVNDESHGGYGRVKVAVLQLLKEHLDQQVRSIAKPNAAPVTLTVNGKKLRGMLYDRTSADASAPGMFIKKLLQTGSVKGRGNNWQLKDASRNLEPLPPPSASTLAMLIYGFLELGLTPKQTYQSLTSLYEGRFQREKQK